MGESSSLPPAVRRDGDDLLLRLRVKPGASRDAVGTDDRGVWIQLRAAAQGGKANRALVALLGREFAVPPTRVSLEKGASARHKTVRIAAPERHPEWLPAV